MKEHRIYVKGKLVSICYSDYAFMCNYTSYREKHGADVEVKVFDKPVNDAEKDGYLSSIL